MTLALALIDLQAGLCSPGGVGAEHLAPRIAEAGTLKRAGALLAGFRGAGLPVFHVRLAFTAGYANRTNRSSRFDSHERAGRFRLGSPDTDFCAEVAPSGSETVLAKGSVSSFASTPLEQYLRAASIDRIILAGVATHLAVESAAREASDRGFAVAVAADACSAPEALHHHAVTSTLPAFATVDTVEHLLAAL